MRVGVSAPDEQNYKGRPFHQFSSAIELPNVMFNPATCYLVGPCAMYGSHAFLSSLSSLIVTPFPHKAPGLWSKMRVHLTHPLLKHAARFVLV